MQEMFYDVKTRTKVMATVTEKKIYGEGSRERYALRGKTTDGRNLTKFVSKTTYDSAIA